MTVALPKYGERRAPPHPMKKVAVIGAGLSGLVTIKELLEENHSVVCFEHEGDIGGVFHSKDEKYGAYNDLHLTISNYFMSFSSFPPADTKRRYWTVIEYGQYLRDFATAFALRPYIRFHTSVLRVQPVDDETWRVTYKDDTGVHEENFDAVAVCSGKFREPRIPKFDQLETFTGTVHHSYKYKSPEPFRNKDVVCVGLGESGSDVVHQIAKVARRAHLVVNRPKHIIPRLIYGDTNDSRTTRASHYSYLVSQSNLEATIKKRVFDRAIEVSQELAAFPMWRYLVKYGFHGEFSNKNDVFFQDIDHGRLDLHLFGIDHMYEHGVVLKDGTRIPCTDLMLSTGYANQFDIIDHPAAKHVAANVRCGLFHMIHPELRDSLVWIGFVRPDVGGVPAVAELQARYFAKLLAGKLQLPPKAELTEEIERLRRREEFHFCLEPGLSENVKYYHITNQIAEKLGVRPRWYHLAKSPRLMLNYYHGSMVACQYRLVGPDNQRAQAEEFIHRVGLTKAPAKHVAFVVMMTSALSAIAPILRKSFKLLRLEQANANRKRRCHSVQEILSEQWPGQGRVARAHATLRSIFPRAYEYEGFKYFLAEQYRIPAAILGNEALLVSELDAQLAGVPMPEAVRVEDEQRRAAPQSQRGHRSPPAPEAVRSSAST